MSREYKSGYECERCDKVTIVTEAVTKLMSVFEARLCVRCRNDWDVFIRPHELFQRSDQLNDRYQMALARTINDGTDRTEELYQIRAEQQTVLIALRDLAAQWVRDA